MPSFEFQRPELEGLPPMRQLRRRQLYCLARAFGIKTDEFLTKSEMLPAMEAAEAHGVFRQRPKYPEWLELAAREPGANEAIKAPVDKPIGFEMEDEDTPVEVIAEQEKSLDLPTQGNYQTAMQAAKSLGINTQGMNRKQLAMALEEKNYPFRFTDVKS